MQSTNYYFNDHLVFIFYSLYLLKVRNTVLNLIKVIVLNPINCAIKLKQFNVQKLCEFR